MPTQIKYNPKSRLTTSLRNRFPLAPTNHSHTPNSPLIEKGLTLLLMRQPDSPPLRWIPPPFSRRLNALCQIIAQHSPLLHKLLLHARYEYPKFHSCPFTSTLTPLKVNNEIREKILAQLSRSLGVVRSNREPPTSGGYV